MDEKIGRITWSDLTVPNAEEVRDFYAAVVGWEWTGHAMGDYEDFSVHPPGQKGNIVAGICHARGSNEGIPPQWLVYINVADLDASIAACEERGGALIQGPRDMGSYGRLAVIRDPAGAVAALIEPPGANDTAS
jgi:predicted enzyme related to lactoylglutathione lyase